MNQLNCILLIDDDMVTNYLHKSLLEELGVAHQIAIYTNGAKALSYLKQACNESSQPELIFLDLNMPVMDGFLFLENFKNENLHTQCKTKIAVLSSSVNPRDLTRIKEIGIAHYYQKPLTAEYVYALANAVDEQNR